VAKLDWSKFDRGVFLVNVLGIVYNPKTKMILIGRRENDPYVKELSWTFPGGRPGYEKDINHYLKLEIKKKTNVDVVVKKVVLARIPPEHSEFLLLYYFCEYKKGIARAGEKFVDVKWVKPLYAQKYFTTSLHPDLVAFLKTLK